MSDRDGLARLMSHPRWARRAVVVLVVWWFLPGVALWEGIAGGCREAKWAFLIEWDDVKKLWRGRR